MNLFAAVLLAIRLAGDQRVATPVGRRIEYAIISVLWHDGKIEPGHVSHLADETILGELFFFETAMSVGVQGGCKPVQSNL